MGKQKRDSEAPHDYIDTIITFSKTFSICHHVMETVLQRVYNEIDTLNLKAQIRPFGIEHWVLISKDLALLKMFNYDLKKDDFAIQGEEIEPKAVICDHHSNQRIELKVKYDFITAWSNENSFIHKIENFNEHISPNETSHSFHSSATGLRRMQTMSSKSKGFKPKSMLSILNIFI